MSWNVVYSAQARLDLRSIYKYIADELRVPETAARQTKRTSSDVLFDIKKYEKSIK